VQNEGRVHPALFSEPIRYMILPTLFCALAFACIHLIADKLTFLDTIPRNRWLSISGGMAVAYVFLHIFPELHASQKELASSSMNEWRPDRLVFLVALLGLSIFYGIERHVRTASDEPHNMPAQAFWLHIGSFALYNILIGFLLVHREDHSAQGLALYVTALGLHFFTNDFGLWVDHKYRYTHKAKWVLAAAVLSGWALGLLIPIHE
jgi:hypothetical protein